MKKLLIVESPAKAKTIEKYLDDEYVVKASVGHVRDLPKSNKKAVDIPAGFVPHYNVSEGKEKVIAELKKAAKKADEVLLATDPDREGEAIAWHVSEVLGLKNPKRVVFHEITKDAVQEATRHPRSINTNLRRAQEARRVLDRLVGYDLSGLIWKKIRYGLSAGRVQSPALRIIVEREREIQAFKPETFWVITADVEDKAKETFTLTCIKEINDKKLVEKILTVGNKAPWVVSDIKETETKRRPRAPFTTSTLQQSASSRLGFSPSRTMRTAQKLYEAGRITYMRTDSITLSKEVRAQIHALVERQFGKEYAKMRVYKTKSKNTQEAHEAIRPTDIKQQSAGSSEDQKKLYKEIWIRAVASQMADAQLLKTKIVVSFQDKEVPDFAVRGSRLLFPGWLSADMRARGEDSEVPSVIVGEQLKLIEMRTDEKETQPPQRYSEAGLIKELEKRGIGRPSTYAPIIKTLRDREYVEKESRSLVPTDTGEVVSEFLEKHFTRYISDSFTSEMENELDEIASGEREYVKTLKDFYDPFSKDVASKEHLEKATNLGAAPDKFPCPACGKKMVIKLGRGGKFMSCLDFPKCHGARTIDGTILKDDEPIGQHPETGEDIYVLTGRFGPYVQLGKTPVKKPGAKSAEKPKRASVPKDVDPSTVKVANAVKYLSLPRTLGAHPKSGEDVVASIGRFGPYVVHDGDFRSLKKDDVYTITLDRALEILAEKKKLRRKRK